MVASAKRREGVARVASTGGRRTGGRRVRRRGYGWPAGHHLLQLGNASLIESADAAGVGPAALPLSNPIALAVAQDCLLACVQPVAQRKIKSAQLAIELG